METYTSIYGPLGIYCAIVTIALVALGIKLYKLIEDHKILLKQNMELGKQITQRDQTIVKLEKENAMLEKQVIQQDQTIEEQTVKIDELEQIVAEQAYRLKQYESFFANLKEAQAKEKARAAQSGVPIDEVRVEATNPTTPSVSQSGSKSAWIMGSMMVARVLLTTVGIPPIF